MRLERISLGGVLRFTDPVTVDLASLPAGLVAVVGANGEGKTTLVESPLAALYRSFPSRDATPLVDYATTRDAFLEAVFTVDTRGTYRARVNLDGQRRAADAVLVHTAPDGTTTTLNDGKLSTYDEAVARVFPTRELLLASAFAAQNRRGSFVDHDRKGRKALFAQLLGLDRFEAMATTAKQAAAKCEAVIGMLGAQRTVIKVEASEAAGDSLARELDAARAGVQRLADGLAQMERDRVTLVARVEDARDRAAAHVRTRDRLRTLATEGAALMVAHGGLLEQERAAVRGLNDETHLLRANHEKALADFDARIARNQALLADAAAVRDAATALRAVQTSLHELDAAIAASTEAGNAWRDEVSQVERQIADVRVAARDLARAEAQAARLTGVCDACAFVADAREAAASLPGLRERVATADALAAQLATLQAHGVTRRNGHRALLEQHQAALQQLRTLEPKAQLLPRLEEAEARIADLQELRTIERETHGGLLAAAESRCADTRQRLAAAIAENRARFDTVGAETAACEADAARTAPAAEALQQAEQALATVDANARQLTADHARLEATASAVEVRLATWREKRAQLDTIDTQLGEVQTEWREWSLLAKALGRDGLPVLEIDAAGPTVSAYTNDLLAVCFGPRFTVELDTQAEKADGKGTKEVFDLRVLDNLRGGDARDLADLSGGEQILVDEALKNALALFINARHAGAVETLWRDETTGPLDPENALRYVEMLRRVREIGHVRHVLFVSHNPAAAALADVQLRLADGRVTVRRPPFQEAA